MNEQLEFSFIIQNGLKDKTMFQKKDALILDLVMTDIDYFFTEAKRIFTQDYHREIQNNLSSCLNGVTLTAEQNRRIIQYQSILNILDLD